MRSGKKKGFKGNANGKGKKKIKEARRAKERLKIGNPRGAKAKETRGVGKAHRKEKERANASKQENATTVAELAIIARD